MGIRLVRKGDGHPHLTFRGKLMCGRVLRENRWSKLHRFGEEVAARMVAATLRRPHAMSAVCARCIAAAGITAADVEICTREGQGNG